MAAWVSADHNGRCSNCSQTIAKGVLIYMRGKTALCESCGLLAANTTDSAGPIESSVLATLAKLPDEANDNPLSQMMLFLAAQIDSGEISSRDLANFTKELRMNMMELQSQYPVEEGDDTTETIRKRRERRARETGGF